MKLPKLKRILTDPDKFLLNGQLKSLVLEVLGLIPMEGIEGSGLNSEEIMEVVLRAAGGVANYHRCGSWNLSIPLICDSPATQ